jgi:AcrR family transcriptional regulator
MNSPRRKPRPAPNPQRRQRLLDAAEKLFSANGYRAVTMAGIAAEAGYAKATAYAYFADKDEIFRKVAEDLAGRILAALEAALAVPGPVEDRLAAALRGKDTLIHRLVAGSPHAGELFAARDRLVRQVFDELDRTLLARVAAALDDGRDRGLPPARLARIVFRASRGLATRAEGVESLGADIEVLVRRLVAVPGRER